MYLKIIRKISCGFDIGQTFFSAIYKNCDILSYPNSELRILAPQYFIDLLASDDLRRYNAPSFDPDGFFEFMDIKMLPSPYEKIIIYNINYPFYKREDMYYEFDLSIFVS